MSDSERNIGIVLKGISDEKWRELEKLITSQDVEILYVRRVPAAIKLRIIEYKGELKNDTSPQ